MQRKSYCGVEQWLARQAHNLKAIGSIPIPATNNYSASQMTGFFLALNPLVSEGFTTLPNSLCP